MKYLLLITIILFQDKVVIAQCQATLSFTEKAMEEITDVYQFTFLHKTPQNKLDSLVKQAMYPHMVIDSGYYEWSSIAPVKSIDRVQYKKIVEDIGRLKTKEAFLILNLQSMLPFKMQDDMTLYATFCSNIAYFGAVDVINKYYLNNAISTKLPRPEFESKVMAKAMQLRQTYFKNIKYCQPLTGEARMLYEMRQFNPTPYDSVIENTITKYLNHYTNKPAYFRHDSIMIEILQIPFVHDAEWDDCLSRVAGSSKAPILSLGVIIEVGKDEFNQKKFIQRVYAVGKHDKGNSILLPTRYDIDFISRTRRLCEGLEE